MELSTSSTREPELADMAETAREDDLTLVLGTLVINFPPLSLAID
jgi:hypothetical protein